LAWSSRRLALRRRLLPRSRAAHSRARFTPVDPTEYPLLYTGDLTAVHLGMTCGRRIFPTLPSTINLRVRP
jgi:hypothetical protein